MYYQIIVYFCNHKTKKTILVLNNKFIMTSNNIPQVKLGIVAVSRDCFPIALSTQRRENIVKAYKGEVFNCQTTVENELDMLLSLIHI